MVAEWNYNPAPCQPPHLKTTDLQAWFDGYKVFAG